MNQYPTLKIIAEKGEVSAIVMGLLPVLAELAIGIAPKQYRLYMAGSMAGLSVC
jgi:hypothetical protein